MEDAKEADERDDGCQLVKDEKGGDVREGGGAQAGGVFLEGGGEAGEEAGGAG